MSPGRRSLVAVAVVACTAWSVSSVGAQEVPRVDYLTLGRGAIPVAIRGAGASMGADMSAALGVVDGRAVGSTIVQRATAETDVEFIYRLPAATTFDRFAVPNVLETPSPSQTFFREVEVYGSDAGPDGPWTRLAGGTLEAHDAAGDTTAFVVETAAAVTWVRLRLAGGLEMLRDQMFLEFGEIIGNGMQESPAMGEGFSGQWLGRGVRLRLAQNGPSVVGCYDRGDPLVGTVDGNLLRAQGVARTSGVESLFVLAIDDDGGVRGVRSTNGAPFRLYEGVTDSSRPLECPDLDPAPLGCGSIIHGIRFDFDSDRLRPESEPVLASLRSGLAEDPAARIRIEGHTSSEGSEAYNEDLSRRRAQAVVAALIERGIAEARLVADGIGEARPIASNDDESGRSLNRRVEVRCEA